MEPPTKKLRTENEDQSHDDITRLKEENEKLQQQIADISKRENGLLMRLSTKEEEIHELQSLVSDLKKTLEAKTYSHIKQTLLDPAVNVQFQKLKEALEQNEKKLKEKQDELDALQFSPNSITGRKLISKCKLLQEENEEFGAQLSEERIHKLENELALQRDLTEEYKKGLYESTEFISQLDEEVEAMQQEIFTLRKQLQEKDSLQRHEASDFQKNSVVPIVTNS